METKCIKPLLLNPQPMVHTPALFCEVHDTNRGPKTG